MPNPTYYGFTVSIDRIIINHKRGIRPDHDFVNMAIAIQGLNNVAKMPEIDLGGFVGAGNVYTADKDYDSATAQMTFEGQEDDLIGLVCTIDSRSDLAPDKTFQAGVQMATYIESAAFGAVGTAIGGAFVGGVVAAGMKLLLDSLMGGVPSCNGPVFAFSKAWRIMDLLELTGNGYPQTFAIAAEKGEDITGSADCGGNPVTHVWFTVQGNGPTRNVFNPMVPTSMRGIVGAQPQQWTGDWGDLSEKSSCRALCTIEADPLLSLGTVASPSAHSTPQLQMTHAAILGRPEVVALGSSIPHPLTQAHLVAPALRSAIRHISEAPLSPQDLAVAAHEAHLLQEYVVEVIERASGPGAVTINLHETSLMSVPMQIARYYGPIWPVSKEGFAAPVGGELPHESQISLAMAPVHEAPSDTPVPHSEQAIARKDPGRIPLRFPEAALADTLLLPEGVSVQLLGIFDDQNTVVDRRLRYTRCAHDGKVVADVILQPTYHLT